MLKLQLLIFGTISIAILLLVASPVLAPSLALTSYTMQLREANRLARERAVRPGRSVLFHGALGVGFVYAWRLSVHAAIVEYSKLPKTQPSSCYIATAAARGHRRVVRSRWCVASDGSRFLANDQLARLKCAELVIQLTCPRLHRFCRAVYDRIGPPLARRLSHPLAADLAYLSLKPIEWVSLGLLRLLAPRAAEIAPRLYRACEA